MSFQRLSATDLTRYSFDSEGGQHPIRARDLIAKTMDAALGAGSSLILAVPVEKPGTNILEWGTSL
jgi:hypothetical protein